MKNEVVGLRASAQELDRAQRKAEGFEEMQDRRDEQTRWERFFVAALTGIRLRTGYIEVRPGVSRQIEDDAEDVVGRAVKIADEAMRVADARAEARRKAGGST